MQAALLLAGFAAVCAFALGSRLASRPMAATALVRRLLPAQVAALHPGFATATLFWDRQATPTTLDLTLTGVHLGGIGGASAKKLTIGIAPTPLAFGQVRLIRVVASGLVLGAQRGPAGWTLDGLAAPPPNVPPVATAPAAPVPPHLPPVLRWLRQFALTDATVNLTGLAPGPITLTGRLSITGTRSNGAWQRQGDAAVTVQAGQATTRVVATLAGTAPARRGGADTGTEISFRWDKANPALAGLSPVADMPVAGQAVLRIRADGSWRSAAAALTLGAGTLRGATLGLPGFALPVLGGRLSVQAGAGGTVAVNGLHLDLAPQAGATPVVSGSAEARLGPALSVSAQLALSGMTLAALPDYWPQTIGHDPRQWVMRNIDTGTVTTAHVAVTASEAAGVWTVGHLDGQVHGSGLQVSWLKPVPPLAGVDATVTLLSPDQLSIAVTGAHQTPSDPAAAPLMLSNLSMDITGLTGAVQTGSIATDVTGPVPQMVALLREKRLHLLSDHPLPLSDPAGRIAAHVTVTLPLDARITVDQVTIKAAGTLAGLGLRGVVAGRDLDNGAVSFRAGNDGLTASGTARLAGLPAQIAAALDFRAGPPEAPSQRYTAHGTAGAPEVLDRLGAGLGGLATLRGPVDWQAAAAVRRDGGTDVTAALTLDRTALGLPGLGFTKPEGVAAQAGADIAVRGGRIGDNRFTLSGGGLDVAGSAQWTPQAMTLTLDRAAIGADQAAGTVVVPPAPAPVQLHLSGPALDLQFLFPPPKPPAAGAPAPPQAAAHAPAPAHTKGRAWQAALRFGRVVLAHGITATTVTADAASDGAVLTRAKVGGKLGGGVFQMAIAPEAGGRRLVANATDGGALLAALDVTGTMRGGVLAVHGRFEDAPSGPVLAGEATAKNFRIGGAPAMARVLQAMTLYGLTDVLEGPGLAFSNLTAPFRYDGQRLTLEGARAFSASLGFTAAGSVDLQAQTLDLSGTIVPGYFFNSLLGRMPLVGKLFSLEKGGGLFAADYHVSGPVAAPAVSVNPLSALTPGFLRGIFGGQAGGR